MKIIFGILAALLVGAILYGILSAILKKYPSLVMTLGIIIGVVVGFVSYWWVGLVVGILAIGFFAQAQAYGGRKCVHCGSYDTEVTKKEDGFTFWECNKCGNITYRHE